uniref:V-type proton ATPase subunit G n=1 Tax=Amazona collaria TaxID=241587 RepID=A0A8B9FV76_9PSIT
PASLRESSSFCRQKNVPRTNWRKPKKGKGKRLKQAKEEAIAEIDHYRLQREKEFRNKQTTVMGSQGNLSAKIEEQTTENIRNLTSSYHKNMESMMKKLLNTICDINPELHPNFRHAV